MADIETLHREFEATYQTESLRKYRFCYNWHSDGGYYISDLTQTAFTAFCAGRQASQAKIERLQAIVDRIPKFADGSPALPGDEAWHPDLSFSGKVGSNLSSVLTIGKWDVYFQSRTASQWQPLSECYPTREQAEAAKGEL